MTHVPDTELKVLLESAAYTVPLGATYAHYKHPDQPYRIDGHCILETTEEVGIVYTALYGAGVTYCRPFVEFMGKVEHNGTQIPRFSRLP